MNKINPKSKILALQGIFKEFRKFSKIFYIIIISMFLYDCSVMGYRYSLSFATSLYNIFLQPTIQCLKAIRKRDIQSVDYVISSYESDILKGVGGDALDGASDIKYQATNKATKLFCEGKIE